MFSASATGFIELLPSLKPECSARIGGDLGLQSDARLLCSLTDLYQMVEIVSLLFFFYQVDFSAPLKWRPGTSPALPPPPSVRHCSDGFIKKSRLQSTQSNNLVNTFWWEKCKMAKVMFGIFEVFSSERVMYQILKSPCIFASDLKFWIEVWAFVNIPTQILLIVLSSIDHSSRC